MLRYSLRQLEYLVACIETGSFAGAAARLNVSQPSISTAIAKLEAAVGVQLLLRHHAQGVSPTVTGARMVQSARSLLRHAEDLQSVEEDAQGRLTSELSLGCFVSLAPAYLPGLLAGLRQVEPGLRLRFTEGTQDALVVHLQQGRCELALLYDLGLPSGLRLTRLALRLPQVVLPADHPLAARKSVSLKALAELPFILLDVEPSREYFLGLLEAAGLRPTVAYRTVSLEVARGLVASGLGYTLLVTRPAGDRAYDGRKIAVRPIREPVEPSELVLAASAALRPTKGMHALEAYAIRFFSTLKETP